MKKGLTEVVFILDESGSMYSMQSDTIGGFNSMLDKQRQREGEILVSAVMFSEDSRVALDRVDIREVKELTREDYSPHGCTALYDAVCDAILHIGRVHKYIPDKDVPEHTLFVITTDGRENASTHSTLRHVRQMIEKAEGKGWEFLFLGANINTIDTARDMGIRRERATDFVCDPEGLKKSYDALGDVMYCMAAEGKISDDWKAEVEEDHRKRGGVSRSRKIKDYLE